MRNILDIIPSESSFYRNDNMKPLSPCGFNKTFKPVLQHKLPEIQGGGSNKLRFDIGSRVKVENHPVGFILMPGRNIHNMKFNDTELDQGDKRIYIIDGDIKFGGIFFLKLKGFDS